MVPAHSRGWIHPAPSRQQTRCSQEHSSGAEGAAKPEMGVRRARRQGGVPKVAVSEVQVRRKLGGTINTGACKSAGSPINLRSCHWGVTQEIPPTLQAEMFSSLLLRRPQWGDWAPTEGSQNSRHRIRGSGEPSQLSEPGARMICFAAAAPPSCFAFPLLHSQDSASEGCIWAPLSPIPASTCRVPRCIQCPY